MEVQEVPEAFDDLLSDVHLDLDCLDLLSREFGSVPPGGHVVTFDAMGFSLATLTPYAGSVLSPHAPQSLWPPRRPQGTQVPLSTKQASGFLPSQEVQSPVSLPKTW